MTALAERRFTPAEAAALSDLEIKAVNNAIDKKIVETLPNAHPGRARRRLSGEHVLQLKLWSKIGPVLSKDLREKLFTEIAERPTARHVKAGAWLLVDVAAARRELSEKAAELAAAEALVTETRDILGGEAVFKGTRVPVRTIAAMMDDGADADEVLDGYPSITRRMVDLARVWAAAHPRRGRPRSLEQRGAKLKTSKRVPLRGDPGPTRSAGKRSA